MFTQTYMTYLLSNIKCEYLKILAALFNILQVNEDQALKWLLKLYDDFVRAIDQNLSHYSLKI